MTVSVVYLSLRAQCRSFLSTGDCATLVAKFAAHSKFGMSHARILDLMVRSGMSWSFTR